MQKLLKALLGAVGITVQGTSFLLGCALALVVNFGGVLLLWWLSVFFYDHGLWPLGALARITAWVGIIGLVGFALALMVGLLAGIVSLVRWVFNSLRAMRG